MRYLDDWLVIAESLPVLLLHCQMLFQLCQDLANVGPGTTHLGMLLDTIQEKVYPMGFRINRFRDLARKFQAQVSPPASMWRELLGHMASLECFLPDVHTQMWSLQWQLKPKWSFMEAGKKHPISLTQECRESVIL